MRIAVLIAEGFEELARQVSPDVELVRCHHAQDVIAAIPTSDALVTGGQGYSQDVADALCDGRSRVRWVQFASAGTDAAARYGFPSGVMLTNAPEAIAPVVAEHAMALLLAAFRRIVHLDRVRATPAFQRAAFLPRLASAEGATLLIVGYGHVARAILLRAQAFGMQCLVAARTPSTASADGIESHPLEALSALVPRADAVVLALALAPDTRGLFGRREIAAMRSSAWLVNVARGAIVDEAALIDALREQRIAGAALDVFDHEPLAADSPLRTLPNVILTPHVAGFGGRVGRARIAAIVSDNIARFAAGHPLRNLVVPGAQPIG